MFELWLNKTKKSKVFRDHISVVELSGGTDYEKILFKNLNSEKMRKVEAIIKDLMNRDATDYNQMKTLRTAWTQLGMKI